MLPPAPLQTLSLLLPVVQQHPALSCLSLNHAARDVECMEEVAHLLASCTQLQQLGLCGCNLEPAVGGEMGGGGDATRAWIKKAEGMNHLEYNVPVGLQGARGVAGCAIQSPCVHEKKTSAG